MPVPRLPPEVVHLVLDYVVSPISLGHPSFYSTLRWCALVCREWAPIAQRHLYSELYFGRGDKKVKQFLAVRPKLGGKAVALVVDDRKPAGSLWSAKVLLELFARCGGVTRFASAVKLEEVFSLKPDILCSCFPKLQTFETLGKYRLSGQNYPFPPSVHAVSLLSRSLNGPETSKAASQLVVDYKAGHLPQLDTLSLLPRTFPLSLLTLASALRTLHLHEVAMGAGLGALYKFLSACTGLTSLAVDYLAVAGFAFSGIVAPLALLHLGNIAPYGLDEVRSSCSRRSSDGRS
ncbi:hypothetical protein JCM10213_008157 [Rhodosporidiobolus nylandii]